MPPMRIVLVPARANFTRTNDPTDRSSFLAVVVSISIWPAASAACDVPAFIDRITVSARWSAATPTTLASDPLNSN